MERSALVAWSAIARATRVTDCGVAGSRRSRIAHGEAAGASHGIPDSALGPLTFATMPCWQGKVRTLCLARPQIATPADLPSATVTVHVERTTFHRAFACCGRRFLGCDIARRSLDQVLFGPWPCIGVEGVKGPQPFFPRPRNHSREGAITMPSPIVSLFVDHGAAAFLALPF